MSGQYSDSKALFLPSYMSKQYVYRQYCQVCTGMGEKAVCRLKFEDLWSELRPNIAAMKNLHQICVKSVSQTL